MWLDFGLKLMICFGQRLGCERCIVRIQSVGFRFMFWILDNFQLTLYKILEFIFDLSLIFVYVFVQSFYFGWFGFCLFYFVLNFGFFQIMFDFNVGFEIWIDYGLVFG